MALSIRDILEIPELDLRLLAGAGATGDPVRWAHVIEVPQTTESLRGGELLLTIGQAFTGSEAQQVERFEELVSRDIAGLGFGTGFGFDEVPPALVRAGEDCGCPVFEVPCHVSFSALTEVVAARIANDRCALLQRTMAVYEKLVKSVLEEEGMEAIVETLSDLTGSFSVLFDFHGVVLAEVASRRQFGSETVAELWSAIVERRAGRAAFMIQLGGASLEACVSPVVAAHRTVAFVAAVKDTGSFGEFDAVVLRSAVTAAALELVRQRAVADTERRLTGDLLEVLANGALPEEEIARRLTAFGLDPKAPHTAMIVEIDNPGEAGAQPALERIRWAADALIAERRLPCISASREGRVVVLLQPCDCTEGDIRALAEELLAVLRGALPDVAAFVGIGCPHRRLADLCRGYQEAAYAIKVRRLRGESGVVAGCAELGSYGLLLSLQDTPSLDVFCDNVLGELERHDEHSSGDLLPSLVAFLEANGRWGDAADKLFIHRHSLRYRMRRVQKITGRDLADPQDRMDFWLALKARELTSGAG